MLSHKSFTLPKIIAWLETKPANEEYDYVDPCNCLFAQFLREQGHVGVHVSAEKYSFDVLGVDTSFKLPEKMNMIASYGGWNFGQALARAKKLEQSQMTIKEKITAFFGRT